MLKNLFVTLILFVVFTGSILAVGNFIAQKRKQTEASRPQPTIVQSLISTSPTSTPIIVSSQNVRVLEPLSNSEIASPVKVRGEARVFENILSISIKDSEGKVLLENTVYVNSPDSGQFGAFEKELKFTRPSTQKGTIDFFQASPKDGSPTDVVTIPITFKR